MKLLTDSFSAETHSILAQKNTENSLKKTAANFKTTQKKAKLYKQVFPLNHFFKKNLNLITFNSKNRKNHRNNIIQKHLVNRTGTKIEKSPKVFKTSKMTRGGVQTDKGEEDCWTGSGGDSQGLNF